MTSCAAAEPQNFKKKHFKFRCTQKPFEVYKHPTPHDKRVRLPNHKISKNTFRAHNFKLVLRQRYVLRIGPQSGMRTGPQSAGMMYDVNRCTPARLCIHVCVHACFAFLRSSLVHVFVPTRFSNSSNVCGKAPKCLESQCKCKTVECAQD
jgi:hypothetical protein